MDVFGHRESKNIFVGIIDSRNIQGTKQQRNCDSTKGEKAVLRYSSTPPYFTYSTCTPLVLRSTPLYSAVLRYTPLYSAVLCCTPLYSTRTPLYSACTPLVLHPYSGVLESRLFPLENFR